MMRGAGDSLPAHSTALRQLAPSVDAERRLTPRDQDSSFMKSKPQSTSPDMPGYCLHPLRDDVPLLDPCSGFLSPGADADSIPGTGKSIPSLLDNSDRPPQHSDPWEQRVRWRTAPPSGRGTSHQQQQAAPRTEAARRDDLLLHRASTGWNSVARPDAALRATLGGWTSKEKAVPQVTRGPGTSLTQKFLLQQSHDASCSRDDMVRKLMYTSSTQRAYEEVPWDIKLPAKLPPPESTKEEMPDTISQHFTLKRYEPQPEIWQVAGGMWDRFQTRMFHANKKPLTFISPYPHMDHIPGYCGFTGSVNTEDIDNPQANFTPFTQVRTAQPRYTSTAHTPNIPGYTGRVHWIAIHPANSNLPSPPSSADTKMNGSLLGSRIGSAFKHQGPLSKMVTTVSPCNPFNKVEKEIE